jgi:hypothetical protein
LLLLGHPDLCFQPVRRTLNETVALLTIGNNLLVHAREHRQQSIL